MNKDVRRRRSGEPFQEEVLEGGSVVTARRHVGLHLYLCASVNAAAGQSSGL